MRITTDRIGVLLANGLSEYQSRVYLALLEYPSMNAGALAKVAGIPRNRLYEVLEELQSLGLVEILLGETRSYRAKPLAAYLDRRVAELRGRINEIETRKDYLAVAFQPPELTASDTLDSGATRVLIGRRAVAREVDRLIDGARASLVVSASAGGADRVVRHLQRAADTLFDAPEAERIPLEVYIPRVAAGAGGFERLHERLLSAIRWIDAPLGSLLVIADGREMLLAHPIPDDAHMNAGRDFAILSTNSVFVRDHLELVRAAAELSGKRSGA